MNRDALIEKITEGLYDSGCQSHAVTIFRENLKFIDWILKKNHELYLFLKSPFNSIKDKEITINNVFQDVLVSEVLIFLKMIVNNNLLTELDEIRDYYDQLIYKDENVAEAKIYSPFKLTEEQISNIKAAFNKKLKKQIVVKTYIDKSLIAGLKVIVDGVLYEYSIASRLDDIKDSLISNINNGEEENNVKNQ